RLEDPGELEIAAARDLLMPFLRRPSYCLSFFTLEPWSLAMAHLLFGIALGPSQEIPAQTGQSLFAPPDRTDLLPTLARKEDDAHRSCPVRVSQWPRRTAW